MVAFECIGMHSPVIDEVLARSEQLFCKTSATTMVRIDKVKPMVQRSIEIYPRIDEIEVQDFVPAGGAAEVIHVGITPVERPNHAVH
jgi:hypothetical protein